MDEVDGHRLLALQGSVSRGKRQVLSCLHDGNGAAACECGQTHVTANVIDLVAYRAARSKSGTARNANWPKPASGQASAAFASMVWPPLMFPLLWTAYWVSVSPMAFVQPGERGS